MRQLLEVLAGLGELLAGGEIVRGDVDYTLTVYIEYLGRTEIPIPEISYVRSEGRRFIYKLEIDITMAEAIRFRNEASLLF